MKLFAFNKNQLAVLSTLLIVIFLGVCYFYIYIPANETAIQEQRFRSLQNIDNNIHAKLDNSVAHLNNLLDTYNANEGNFNRIHLNNYIRNYSKANFRLKVVDSIKVNAAEDSIATIEIDSITNHFDIILNKKYGEESFQTQLRYSLTQFIKYLLPKDIFDEYVIFHEGKVIYQTFASGINYARRDSLLSIRNGVSNSNVKRIKASGKEYLCFLQPVKLNGDKEWIVAGMLSNKRYVQEKKQLPTGILLLMLTAGLAMVLAFPWIKLYQMGNQDRLTIIDGVSTIVVSMLLMSLLYFAFVKYNHGLKPNTETPRKVLAHKIDLALDKELETAAKILIQFDAINNEEINGKVINNLGTDSVRFSTQSIKSLKPVDKKIFEPFKESFNKLNINQVFWLNNKGQEKTSWVKSSSNSPLGDLSSREYFKNIKEGRGNFIDSTGRIFYLDQVISLATGVFTSVLSTKSHKSGDTAVVALSFNSKSLDKVILPLGFQFSIINENGRVLYHSQPSRNLNENLLIEFSESEKLSSSLASQSESVFTTNYFSKQYNVYVNRLQRLPFSIVVFEDSTYRDTRDTEVYSFTISMLLCWSLFLALELIVIFFASAKRSFLKKQLFDTSWIGPKISSKHEYDLCILGNCIIIALLIIFYRFSGFLDYLLILLAAVSLIGIFLNIVFLRKYKNENKKGYVQYKSTAIYALAAFILLKNIVAYKLLDLPQFIILNAFQLSCLLMFGLVFYYENAIFVFLRKYKSGGSNFSFSKSFTLMVLTRLIVTSGIPVAFFYIASYNYEHNLSTRYRQVDFANKISEKVLNPKTDNAGIYPDGTYVKSIKYNVAPKPVHYSRQDSITFLLFTAFRMQLNSTAIQINNFYLPTANTSFTYNNLLKKDTTSKGSVTYKKLNNNNKLEITSADVDYRFPDFTISHNVPWQGALFWLLFIAAHYLFFVVLNNITKRLFSIDLPSQTAWGTVDETLLENFTINNLLFLIGSPGSGKLKLLMEKINKNKLKMENGVKLVYDKIDPGNNNVFIADMILIPETAEEAKTNPEWLNLKDNVCNEDYKLIIINHFEYNIKNAATNHIKLDLLETLLHKNQAKLIIVSTIHPVSFLDSFHSHQLKPQDAIISLQDLERWHVLLGHFRIIVQPIEGLNEVIDLNSISAGTPAEIIPDWEKSLKEETNYSHFLTKMQEPVISGLRKKMKDTDFSFNADSMAFKLQITSHYFYMYIWQSLTKEEKFLLYDLAEDGLVNPFDDYNLTLLISKGIIIRSDGTLKLFNKGFRNFILTAIGNTEAMKIKNEIRDNGNWSKLRTPLIIVILAIFAFLLASQQETYSRLITYVTALAAGVPTLMKLFSIFDKNTQKSE